MRCYFVSDLHGKSPLYERLFKELEESPPEALFVGGDIFPHGFDLKGSSRGDFLNDFLIPRFKKLKRKLGSHYPEIFIILGNDDPRSREEAIIQAEDDLQIWRYIHNRRVMFRDYPVFGYSFVPPTPFVLKDWEKYDVSRFVDPGCSHPMEGSRTVKPDYDTEFGTIKDDLEELTGDEDLSHAIMLFHSPPYDTPLDRAALDGKMIDFVPLDVHVGSIAIQRFILTRKPLLTLHGHIHEASSITGTWSTKLGDTIAYNAAWNKNALSIISFDPANPEAAERQLLEPER